MQRVERYFPLENIAQIKRQLLYWGGALSKTMIWLDSNENKQPYSEFEALLAVDAISIFSQDCHHSFENLKAFRKDINDWIFGYFGYDLKNDIEELSSENIDELLFPDTFFFQPKKIITLQKNSIVFLYPAYIKGEIEDDFRAIKNQCSALKKGKNNMSPLKHRTTKDAYYRFFSEIINQIKRGNIYQANYCIELFSKATLENPIEVFEMLNNHTKMPFSSLMIFDSKIVMSVSPERFLKRQDKTLLSQPMKGTSKSSEKKSQNKKLIATLQTNPKERAENIMIADLVRNDISKVAKKGSVCVDSLCRVEAFKGVNQMITDITATIKKDIDSVDVIKAMFPIASMTGVPKLLATTIIEQNESFKRGAYSGALGYFQPNNDFDFSVIIRTILTNQKNNYLSLRVGGAITASSTSALEYEECNIKIEKIKKILELFY